MRIILILNKKWNLEADSMVKIPRNIVDVGPFLFRRVGRDVKSTMERRVDNNVRDRVFGK